MNRRPDPGHAGLLRPLLDALAPASVLVCDLDVDADDLADLDGLNVAGEHPAGAVPRSARVVRCTAGELAGALQSESPDVVRLRGRASWHAVTALADTLAAHLAGRGAGAPVIVAEHAPAVPLPPWTANEAYAEHLERAESAKEGMRAALAGLAARLDPPATLLWCAAGRGTAAVVPAAVAERLGPWLDGRAALLAELDRAHAEQVRLTGRSFELFEQLDRSQRTATRVVRSLRFRVGTRIVRLGRKVLRREETFRAPRTILARAAVTERWRERLAAERDVAERVPPAGALRVTYVLPELRLSGGGLVVAELVNELRVLGVDARLATLKVRADAYRTRLLDRPMVFASADALVDGLPPADVIVATHWSTAQWARRLVDAGRAPHAAYFVQDYEAWFYDDSDVATREQVRRSYGLVADKIVTSQWLHDLLDADGFPSRVIAPGIDLDVFYPRPVPRARPVVLAMARPRTPRRGFDTVVAALTTVHEQHPEAEIVLFGERLGEMRLPFPYRPAGVIAGQDRLARLYSQATVHFDGSDFQAFGRAALEGMACGAVPVLTRAGGVGEYARDGDNCLLVDPRDPAAAAGAIGRLLDDPALHDRLFANGLAMVRACSMRQRARETLAALRELSGRTA